jgi:transcriptional regulator with XRE-family HTH domain
MDFMEIERRQIPNKLRKYRKLAGYSQVEVARKLGFKSTSRISRWENGLAYPNLENLLKLSVIYCTLSEQFYYELYCDIRDELLPEEEEEPVLAEIS